MPRSVILRSCIQHYLRLAQLFLEAGDPDAAQSYSDEVVRLRKQLHLRLVPAA